MDPLVSELIARGVLDHQTLDFARAYQVEHGTTLDAALLELDLVDEQELLAGLESCYQMKALRREDIARADPEVSIQFSPSVAKSFGLCPLCFEDGALVCLVKSPLPEDTSLELLELFGLVVRPRLAPEHYFDLVRAGVYAAPISPATAALEARLARRRQADVRRALENVERTSSLGAAAEQVIAFAQQLLDFSCLLVFKNQRLRAAVAAGGQPPAGTTLPLPEADCPLRAAVLHGGYFFGPLTPTPGAKRFYESLQRPLPRWALVAPVPSSGDASMVFCADNGPRAVALRTVAELALLIARMRGRVSSKNAARALPAPAPAEMPATSVAAETPALQPLSAEEISALERLRQAAATANKSLTAFVDELLQQASQPRTDAGAALVGEVKELFDKLATDIPAHFARGIEGAFRDLVPRLAAVPLAAPPSAEAPRPAAAVDLVFKEAAPREVPDYQSRRRKTTRVKL